MILSRFQSLYHNTESPLPEDVTGLHHILQKFPYFYPALALQCRLMKQLGHIDYEKILSLAAAYAPDRSALYHFIHAPAPEEPAFASTHPETAPLHTSSQSSSGEELSSFPETEESFANEDYSADMDSDQQEQKHKLVTIIQERMESAPSSPESHLQESKSDEEINPRPALKEVQPASILSIPGERTFSDWLKLFSNPLQSTLRTEESSNTAREATHQKKTTANNPTRPIPPEGCSAQDPTTLIDKFIAADPSISPAHSGVRNSSESVNSPSEAARQSVEDHDDIASPTLAHIYLMQGHKEKAIEIYRRLILLYPEKSHSFAAEIEKIKQT